MVWHIFTHGMVGRPRLEKGLSSFLPTVTLRTNNLVDLTQYLQRPQSCPLVSKILSVVASFRGQISNQPVGHLWPRSPLHAMERRAAFSAECFGQINFPRAVVASSSDSGKVMSCLCGLSGRRGFMAPSYICRLSLKIMLFFPLGDLPIWVPSNSEEYLR
ncbi:hypothetical protein MPTK1_7g13610 [Marchantia polymorpha subsp. ruderalis]|uniref:Uncharacterized protein n=2 Tax=Marchantia polymorpha TaxID=3197 RepID=A0AAF6BZ86_MARPO|nr:hypothetical protein MARPO_0009s0046 [Marchantia polymorpha]BBN17320.1 hypothetical protein Mp_7g13610 [Marchantia polymorpha subsp. ruderalis]|eukprot:PTQ46924.1 hypothetical protein MARPO_0009s0046 [Marchantia polymorpha]